MNFDGGGFGVTMGGATNCGHCFLNGSERSHRRFNCTSEDWDCDGLGVSLKRQVTESLDGKKIDIRMFKGSESPVNPEDIYQPDTMLSKWEAKTNEQTFKNKRAQNYIRLRDRFYATYRAIEKGEYLDPDEIISISSSIGCMEAFRSEVCRIPLKHNGSGFLQIMNKVEMKNVLKIASPNLSDSAMMSLEEPDIVVLPDYSKFTVSNTRRLF